MKPSALRESQNRFPIRIFGGCVDPVCSVGEDFGERVAADSWIIAAMGALLI